MSFPFLVLSLVATLVIGWLTTWLWRQWWTSQQDRDVNLPLPPGSLGWPLVGESVEFLINSSKFYVQKFQKYGRLYKTHLLGQPTVRLTGADVMLPLIRSPSVRIVTPTSVRAVFGQKSLVAAPEDVHTRLKGHVMEAFTPSRLSDYLPGIQYQVRTHLDQWCSQGPMLGFPACESLTCDVALELVLGCSKNFDAHGRVRAAVKCLNENFFCLPIRIPGLGMDKLLKSRQIVAEFLEQRIHSKGDKDFVSVLDVLVTKLTNSETDGKNSVSSGLSPDELVDNLLTLFAAGAGTTSGALCCSLMVLAQHPEILSRLREELEANGLLGDGCREDLTYDVIQSLKFTHCVIKEVLRLYTPVGGIFRQATKTLEVNGYQIPKDWTMIFSIRDTHRLPSVFEEPLQFQPQRWQDPQLLHNLEKENFGGYLPFGHGAAICPGRKLAQLVMAVFLVEVASKTTFKVDNLHPKTVFLPVTKPADNLPVKFQKV